MTSKRCTHGAYDLGMGDSSVRIEDAGDLRVRQAMIAKPKSVLRTASVGEARIEFANPKNRLLLVVDEDGKYAGHVLRDDISEAEADAAPLWGHVRHDCPVIDPDALVSAALPLASAAFDDRLVVVGEDGELAGLLCLNRRDGYLCVDVRG
jgi:CBS domain-containing protein